MYSIVHSYLHGHKLFACDNDNKHELLLQVSSLLEH
jgi:hypothetical protein